MDTGPKQQEQTAEQEPSINVWRVISLPHWEGEDGYQYLVEKAVHRGLTSLRMKPIIRYVEARTVVEITEKLAGYLRYEDIYSIELVAPNLFHE